MRPRATRSGSYDAEAQQPEDDEDDKKERRGWRRGFVSSVAATVGLCVVAYVLWPRQLSPVDAAAHKAAASALRARLAELTRRIQTRVRHRRERHPAPSFRRLAEAAPPRASVGAGASASDAALAVLRRRVATAEREAWRQENVDREGAYESLCDRAPPKPSSKRVVRVATVNLWQPQAASWPARRRAIAGILREAAPDIVAMQEVRGGANWAEELRRELEGLDHARYVAGTGDGRGGAAPPGWTEEGVAILSRFALEAEDTVGMPPARDSSDRNPRTTLGARVATPLGTLRVVASHLSYDRDQQCRAVRDHLKPWLDGLWDSDKNVRAQVLLGDLNIYPDFEWPIDTLELAPDVRAALGSPCAAGGSTTTTTKNPPVFVDAWTATRNDDPGWTFPNPETLHLDPARPDRVLVRGLVPREAFVLGCDPLVDNPNTWPSDHRILVVDLVR
ncbi:hypothetical protein CTAYLR_006728 [Chrysophaeum taylorii]|uniref:Endonuclease/exonuclease/phosphatase domain-containing protein n=1 Tax=Chrysophaeum taylorii TaxID=2483200 RepID=A0AAD7UBH8_9STRA|nr:hypothetical protein CTAYLR_006728 [Chrysophaeum taylorii]